MWQGAVLRRESVSGLMPDLTSARLAYLLASVTLTIEINRSDDCSNVLAIARLMLLLKLSSSVAVCILPANLPLFCLLVRMLQ